MFTRLLQITTALALALAGGTYFTWVAISGPDKFGTVTIGRWIAHPESGSVTADPYSKARLARNASLALGVAEGIIFLAERDESGSLLTGSCSYLIKGSSPAARLWTMSALGDDQLPVRLSDAGWPTSLHSQQILYEPNGDFHIAVAASARPDNWLAVQAGQTFTLAFTLYDSTVATTKGLVETTFPTVTKVNCHA